MEIHKAYREMFDKCSISCSAEVNASSSFSYIHCNCDSSKLTRLIKFAFEALEGNVASQVGTPGLSLIPKGISRAEVRGSRGRRNGSCLFYPSLL
jgi:hypothetical protein